MSAPSLQRHYDLQVETILGACTACGKCVQACPIAPTLDLPSPDGERTARGVLAILRREDPEPDAARWTQACAGSGECLEACPEGINPRQMLSLAKNILNGRAGGGPYRDYWRTMGRLTRTLAGMQLTPAERLKVASSHGRRPARIVFWVGCNIPRTSHMVLLLVDILEKMGLDCEVLGGMNNCCGIVQFLQGDNRTGEKVVQGLARNLASLTPDLVLSWCPTCQIQFDELLADYLRPGFPVRHTTAFLAASTDRLRPLIVKPIPKRVAIHEHSGLRGAMDDVKELLQLIPDLQIVAIDQIRNYGYMCSRLDQAPEAKRRMHEGVLEAARAAALDALLTVYHSCHRELAAYEGRYPFQVRNVLDVLGEAMGLSREDKYKKWLHAPSAAAITEDAGPFIAMNRLSPADVRFAVEKAFGKPSAPDARIP